MRVKGCAEAVGLGIEASVSQRFPTAKFDSATTKSIELLPRKVKDEIFSLVIQKKSIDMLDDFLKRY